jgi:hypothetical protein
MSIDVNVQNDLVIVTESSEDITVNVSNAAGPAGANGVGVPIGGTTGQVLKKFTNTNYDTYWAADASGLTSVGLSMPSAFAVSNSPLTSNGTLAVTGAGTASQYVRGDGQLANFPDNGGGGSSVNYYLNGSVTQGTFGGDTYYEMSKTPILGAGTDFTRTNAQGNGYIASFITDAGDPSLLNIPGGNWNVEFYFQSSASGGSPQFYAELYKVNASNVFTLVASGSTNPEGITNGTTIDQYFTSIPVPQTSLLVTDRLAIRIYVITSGRTITLHTEDGNLCEVLTTLSTGLNALNGLTSQVQYFATGTSGTDFAISSATDTHTFNLPTASATNRGALSSADWSTFSGKVGGSGATGQVAYWNGTNSQTGSNNLFWDAANSRLGIGTNTPSQKLSIIGNASFDGANPIITMTGNGASQTATIINDNGNGTRLVLASANIILRDSNSIDKIRLYQTGNLVLQNGGTFTDGGQRLQVQGDAFIKGSGATSATIALQIQNSSSQNILQVFNDGMLKFGNANNAPLLYTGGGPTINSQALTIGLNNYNSWGNGESAFTILTNTNTTTAGTSTANSLTGTFAPGSGSHNHNFLRITATINQTGGANGITRGLFIQPFITAAADWRSIEWSNNSGWGLYGAGTANNLLNGDLYFGNDKGYVLQTNGTNRNISIKPSVITDNFAGAIFYPSSGTNVGCTFTVSPRGSGYSSGIKSQIWINNTDFVADASNYEFAVFRAAGDRFSLTTGKAGTGTIRPFLLSAGFADASTNPNQLWLYASGRVGIGTSTESTFLLDVNGTARVSGDTSIDGVLRETVTTNRQTASYSLVLTDRGKLVEMNVGSANNLTVPLNSSIAFPIGSKIDIAQYGAGQTTVVATSGVTIRSAAGALKLAAQYSGATLVKIASDEWYLFGNISI